MCYELVIILVTDGSFMEPSVIPYHRRFYKRTVCDVVFNKRNVQPRRAAEPGARTRAAEGTGEGGELALIAK